MAQSLIACPLCSSASFSSTSALCLSLVSVTSKWLRCTLCEEELRGLDKLTIHLLSHLIHTTDFKRFLTEDKVGHSSDAKLVLNHEPLNLVKSQSNEEKEVINTKSTSDIYHSFSFPSKDAQSERPSLKIDDEVMIFFNCNDKNSEKQHKNILNETKPGPLIHSTELPKFIFDFNKNIDRQNEDLATEENNMILNDMYPTSTNQSPPVFLSTEIKPSHKDMAVSTIENDHQLGLPLVVKGSQNVDFIANDQIDEQKRYSNLEKHVESKNSFLSPKGERVVGYRCDICSLVFPDKLILSMHRQLIHIELTGDPSKTNSYKCHLCSKSFVMKGSLMVHMRVAHFGGAVVARLVEAKQLETNAVSPESAQFVCSICNKGFRKEQQLTQHEKLHEGKQCDVCFKTFTTKYFLRKHKRLHTGEMPYTCRVCDKSFTFQQSYHKHLLYHSDDKPYSCGDCGRSFKELSTLHNHQRIHTGEKPFSCETCGKCFRQRVSYLVHRRIHTGVMPYQCQDCGKTFRYKVSERTHKCVRSTPTSSSSNAGVSDLPSMDTSHAVMPSVPLTKNKDIQENSNRGEENGWHQSQNLGVHQTATVEEHVYPEATDFFSLVMSPSDRLQQLSLTTEEQTTQPDCITNESIDTESLKQLLYDVADYN